MMKKINICLLIRFFFIMLTIVSATGICTADTTLPAFPEMFQEHGNWCWAGTSEAVIEYYGTSVTQCAIANWSWGRSDCCGNTDLYWSHPCNQPQWNYGRSGSSQDILQNWGVNSNGLATYLLWPTAVSEINAGRPFVMRFAWIPEGGHALDGYGYDDQTGTANDYLLYMDPWPGNGYTKSLYTWVVSAADHNWTHTLQITTNPTKPSTENPNLTPYQPEGWTDKIVVSKTTGTNTDSSPLYTTDILYVDWAVINNGSVVTPTGFTVALYVDSVLEATWSPAPLDVNYYQPGYDYSIGSLAVGTHTIKIVADPTGVISESIEGDNEYTKTITVVSQTEGTFGTEWTITGSGFGTKKGKVLIGSTPVTIIDWADGLIHCRLAKVRAPGVYDVTIQPIGPQGTPSIIVKDGFTVKAAEVHSIDVGSGSAYDQVTITGKFFGTKKGAVYLEYGEGEYLKRKSCKVSSWTMEPTTGDSEIVFVVPKMLPEVCDVVVDPYGTIPDAEDEEEHGFTVKAPEIVSITPNSGSVGEQITISGNFFGSKKPKVYLGYVSNGKPTKKSCSVVSWSDDEIILTVPKFPLGTYDVIVTNSVSSDTLPGGFIIK
jgi:hypothetical protein